jgi:hypothetical protein
VTAPPGSRVTAADVSLGSYRPGGRPAVAPGAVVTTLAYWLVTPRGLPRPLYL